MSEGTAAWHVARKVLASGKAALAPEELKTFESELVPALRAMAQQQSDDELQDRLGDD